MEKEYLNKALRAAKKIVKECDAMNCRWYSHWEIGPIARSLLYLKKNLEAHGDIPTGESCLCILCPEKSCDSEISED